MASLAYLGFEASIKDADQLFAFYEKERLAALPSVPEEIEVLKRSALILSVTAWETYLEDFLREKFDPILRAAAQPSDVQSVFNTVAAKWIDSNNRTTLQNTLCDWTGVGWKGKIKSYFGKQINELNTPNSEKCSRLFKVFLNVALKDYWKWRGYNYTSAASRLDAIISVRGKVTHMARKAVSPVPTKHVVSRADIESYIRFIKEIALATDRVPWLKNFMPTDLIHRIGIAAPAETIYRALTTEEGIHAWWTTDAKIDASAGGAPNLSRSDTGN